MTDKVPAPAEAFSQGGVGEDRSKEANNYVIKSFSFSCECYKIKWVMGWLVSGGVLFRQGTGHPSKE